MNNKIAKQFEVGRLHFKGGNYHRALEAYNWIVEKFPEKAAKSTSAKDPEGNRELVNIHYHRTLSYYELNNYAAAIEAAQTCLSLNSEPDVKVRVQYLLAMSAEQNRINDLAESVLLPLIKYLQGRGNATQKDSSLLLLASAHFQMGRLAVVRGAY